mmetsp:Transcript_14722/g.48130  ORF Transcript_14722/g.48130 Transcript_14722/m.48130 type:complete len:292 (-) Transcript_14722:895-1770(-)
MCRNPSRRGYSSSSPSCGVGPRVPPPPLQWPCRLLQACASPYFTRKKGLCWLSLQRCTSTRPPRPPLTKRRGQSSVSAGKSYRSRAGRCCTTARGSARSAIVWAESWMGRSSTTRPSRRCITKRPKPTRQLAHGRAVALGPSDSVSSEPRRRARQPRRVDRKCRRETEPLQRLRPGRLRWGLAPSMCSVCSEPITLAGKQKAHKCLTTSLETAIRPSAVNMQLAMAEMTVLVLAAAGAAAWALVVLAAVLALVVVAAALAAAATVAIAAAAAVVASGPTLMNSIGAAVHKP